MPPVLIHKSPPKVLLSLDSWILTDSFHFIKKICVFSTIFRFLSFASFSGLTLPFLFQCSPENLLWRMFNWLPLFNIILAWRERYNGGGKQNPRWRYITRHFLFRPLSMNFIFISEWTKFFWKNKYFQTMAFF